MTFWQRPEAFGDPAFELIARFRDPLKDAIAAPPSMGLRPVPIRKGSGEAQRVIGSRLAEGNDGDHEKRIKAWREQLRAQATNGGQPRELLRGPLAVEMTFVVPRTKADYATGRNAGELRPGAPAFPVKRPDQGKQARLIEDALTGVIWADDAQIVDPRYPKRFGRTHGVRIRVWELEALEAERVDAERRRELLERLFALSADAGQLLIDRLEGMADDLADEHGSLAYEDVIERLRQLARVVRLEVGA